MATSWRPGVGGRGNEGAVAGGGTEGGAAAEGGRTSLTSIPGPLLRAAYYERPLRSVPPCLTDVRTRVRVSGQGQGQG